MQDVNTDLKASHVTRSPQRSFSLNQTLPVNTNDQRVSNNSDPKLNRVSGDSGLTRLNNLNMLNKDSDSLTEIHEPEQDLKSKRDKQISSPGNENLQIVTRSGKVAGLNNSNQSTKGFGSNVALTDTVINALQFEHQEESASLGVPAVPFESLT
ncbi:hypothetical protein K3495_g5790 [Podosphaera aphanis]|nr:hypothetical protein K3495_g5790 [Podosphaera aphanis]